MTLLMPDLTVVDIKALVPAALPIAYGELLRCARRLASVVRELPALPPTVFGEPHPRLLA
jgi:hypothetical protein